MPGDLWVTATVAAGSTKARRNVPVRRYDAPLPETLANLVHELWVRTLEKTAVDEEAIPESPTGIFSATTKTGSRLRGVTVFLHEQDSICIAMMDVGESLIDYAKSPRSKRAQMAAELEKECTGVLRRIVDAGAPNQAMQLTASKPAIYAGGVCRRERMPRAMHGGLAAADLVSR